jgi:hypothetical protein
VVFTGPAATTRPSRSSSASVKHRGDFLDVMRDQEHRRGLRGAGESSRNWREMLARHGVEARAGFIENEQAGPADQGTCDEDASDARPGSGTAQGRSAR